MSAESPRHARSGGPMIVAPQPPSDRSLINAVSGFINDVTLSSASTLDPKDTIQWARFETADINEPIAEGEYETELSPLLLILGYGAGVQVWVIRPNGDAQEVLSWRQGAVRVLRILPTPQYGDSFVVKRPLIALCDSAGPGPTFCSLSFISVRGGEQVKSIKFKNPILDVLANKRSVVVSFSERFAVFDAGTLEDRLAITTCYPCPCPLGGSAPINPLALGDRWLAYADKKLNPSKRSSGGCEGEGVSSYTATVLHAAKSLSKGLRGLGETVAHSLAGGRTSSQSPSPPNTDLQQPGVVTILDIEANSDDDIQDGEEASSDPSVAHFVAHSDAVTALKFDASGLLLVTADRRGHDFHVFRVNPHPCGPSLASVHHLYILHRGDTTAKVQDIAISYDSRWVAVSTLRGTTHVFPVTPYGGACGVRTHTQSRVVNRLSRFHRSAGLPIHSPARCGSPVGECASQGTWYANPRLPPYPLPTAVTPLAQLRPTAAIPTHTITRNSSGRQRLSSLSEDSNIPPLLARARFGPCAPSTGPPRSPAAHSLYLMAANGCLQHYVLSPKAASSVPKEKVCDESPIELEVEALSQWPLQRHPAAADLLAPLPPTNPLLQPLTCRRCVDACASASEEERWCAQVEIATHAGPHRRLWMGPQFVFKTYNFTGSSSSLSEAEAVEVEAGAGVGGGVARSTPVNMPGARPVVPVLIDSGSASSLEHSPSEGFRRKSSAAEGRAAPVCDLQLKEDLAEAMKEDQGSARVEGAWSRPSAAVVRVVDPLGTVVVPAPHAYPEPAPDDPDVYTHTNRDEATFRPVVRAPAALPPAPHIVARPLPADTTIPVQTVAASDRPEPPQQQSRPLNSDVVIPAALTAFAEARPHPRPRPRLDFKPNDEPIDVHNDLKCDRYEAIERLNVECEANLAVAARDDACELRLKSLPLANRALPDEIQVGGAKARVKICPTPKSVSDKEDSEIVNVKASQVKVKDADDESAAQEHSSLSEKITESVNNPDRRVDDIRTEEQAWDMLMNDAGIKMSHVEQGQTVDKSSDEVKPKFRKQRKNKSKQRQDDASVTKTDDSFVEIHAIEHQQSAVAEDLVAISEQCGETEQFSIDLLKPKHSMAPLTSASKKSDFLAEFDLREPDCGVSEVVTNFTLGKYKSSRRDREDVASDQSTTCSTITTDISSNKRNAPFDIHDMYALNANSIQPRRGKSASPYMESSSRKIPDKFRADADKRDLIIIDSTTDDFPEIQITRGSKPRKRSPQPQSLETGSQERELLAEKPQKSWSSIAASRSGKKPVESKDQEQAMTGFEDLTSTLEDMNCSRGSLEHKLMEICNQTDIVVAECDAPTGLHFVEEHHTLCELPPLEPLDFALDDFKLEMMRDSILEVNDAKLTSPICKINIDDILTSIKETGNKALESSAYNLVAFEKVPISKHERRETQFSVVESERITTREIDVKSERDIGARSDKFMEKSSDDDNASPVSSQTDSDKDDKKAIGVASLAPPSKQAAKRKARRKKK